MKNILSKANREILKQFAWSNVLVAFDYDGTLAPIADKPDGAVMRRVTRQLLEEIAKLYPCIVISGRTRIDALKRLEGVRMREVVGDHGIESRQATDGLMDEVQRWRAVLEKRLSALSGVKIESKSFSVAVHYRHSWQKKKARAAILEAVAALGKVRVIGGKQSVNVLPNSAPDKGVALQRERKRLHCDTAIYVGDDETDEDVFRLDQPEHLLTIRVGSKRASMAGCYIQSQADIDDLLRLLIGLRREYWLRAEAVRCW